MEQIVLQRHNNNIAIFYKDNLIEEYFLTTAVDFNLLMKFFIKDELSNKFELCTSQDLQLSEEENVLIGIIKSIIDDYNLKSDDFLQFTKSNI
jgi:hypothetical protein